MMPARRGPRPRRAALPLFACVGVLAAWLAIAHDSGAGWVQATGALVAGVLVVGLVAPALFVSRLDVRIDSCPADALAGAPTALQVTVSGPAEIRAVSPPGPPTLTGRSSSVAVEVRPERRGVVDACTLEVASAAPFGLLWWTRTVTLPLVRPLTISPRSGAPTPDVADVADDAAPSSELPGAGTVVRGVRPYAPGDARHLVHWPATAHTGRLMVRETERPAPRTVVVDGTLPDDLDAADERASRLLGTVAELLAKGCRVELRTLEPAGEVAGVVATVATAGRRLARALPRVDRR